MPIAITFVEDSRATFTPWMPSGNGLSHRVAAAALLELLREIDRSYKMEDGDLGMGGHRPAVGIGQRFAYWFSIDPRTYADEARQLEMTTTAPSGGASCPQFARLGLKNSPR